MATVSPVRSVSGSPRRRFSPNDVLHAIKCCDVDLISRLIRRNPGLVTGIHGIDGCTPILLACKLGHMQLVKLFFQHGATVDDRDRDPKRQGNPLHYAAWGGHIEIVRWLVDVAGASLDDVDIVGNTALLYAVYGGHRDIIDELVSRGRSLRERNSKNHTALLQAACGGHLDIVKWLLEQGFSLTECDHDGNTSLLFAAWGGHLELIQFLLKNGSSLTEQNQNGHSVFLSAANGGRVHVVEWLLDNGFSINETNNNGDTALLLAAYGGHRDLVERLLELGASLADKNACGFTPLLSAANGGQLEMARWLLDNGASLDEADYDGYTSLILAACGGNVDLVKFFISRGALVKEQNSNGDTALLLASYCGHRDLVDWLLKNGSSLDEKNDTGMGALISAANGGVPEVVDLLLQRIAESGPGCGDGLESTDEGGYTPLLLAAQRGHLDVVKLLAGYGANIHALTSLHQNNALALANEFPEAQAFIKQVWNWRPLQIAVETGNYQRVHALVQAGVDTFRGYTGPAPLELACSRVDAQRRATSGSEPGSADQNNCLDIMSLLKRAQMPWSPSRHMLFPVETRRQLRTTLMLIPRMTANERLPSLPLEMWMHIMTYVAHSSPEVAQAKTLQIGWLRSTLPSKCSRKSALQTVPDLNFVSDDDDDDVTDMDGRRARNSTSKLRCRTFFNDAEDESLSDDELFLHSRDRGVLVFSNPQRSSARV